ncbi:MAG: phosphotransferase [Myxococcota bacterium]|nr:phosphotransferase [Myxococcota bacterium]
MGGDRFIEEAAQAFAAGGRIIGNEPLGRGHIHATRLVRVDPGARRLVLQRINTRVFRDPEGVMENLLRVTGHLRAQLEASGAPDVGRRSLAVLRTGEGAALYRDGAGGVWRAFDYVEGGTSIDRVEGPAQAYEAARAFGRFAASLADLPGPPLHETIPHFHDMRRRVEALEAAVLRDPCGRAGPARPELGRLRDALAALEAGLPDASVRRLPRRVVHHDCKLNNLLLDEHAGQALCVIDLDTVMKGTLLSDFGELARTASCRADEDERDLSRVAVDLELFRALAAGYLEGLGPLPEPAERRALPFAGTLLTLMNAVRFLTDHLEGDVYFPTHREAHNLERARAQLRLAETMLESQAALVAAFQEAPQGGRR